MIIRKLLIFLFVFTLFSCQTMNGENCKVPTIIIDEIEKIRLKKDVDEDDFFRINEILFEHQYKDSILNLSYCNEYKQNINTFFESTDIEKRLTAYRLIGVAQDSTFNDILIERIKSDESSLLKTWSSMALMMNKSHKASDDLFKLFSSYPKDLPVDILINVYIRYDTIAVKNTCWKYINSTERSEQIMSIQCLANLGKDKELQKRLLHFLNSWEEDDKGWVISSMAIQRMGNLKPLLEKYTKIDKFKWVTIKALENSPTQTDKEFASQLQN